MIVRVYDLWVALKMSFSVRSRIWRQPLFRKIKESQGLKLQNTVMNPGLTTGSWGTTGTKYLDEVSTQSSRSWIL